MQKKLTLLKKLHFSQETGSSDESPMIEEDGHDEVMETSPNMDTIRFYIKENRTKELIFDALT